MADEPAYQRIAAHLRARIADGTYRPGDRLPSVRQLAAQEGVSHQVTQAVYGVLVVEGAVEAHPGRGYYVPVRPPARRVALDRYRREAGRRPEDPLATSFTEDRGITWAQYRLDKRFERTSADEQLAALFEVEPGTSVLARHFVFHGKGEPEQMSRSCVLVSDVENTPVADPANEPWPGGTPAQLASIGLPVSRVEESVRSRMPTPEEARTLRIRAGVPVVTITRRMLSGGRVVEVAADIVIPADRVVLEYAIDL